MTRRGSKALCLVLVVALVGIASPAHARKKFPRHIDRRSWTVPEEMEWSDYVPIPGVDWLNEANQPPKKLRAALILGDFADQPFRVSQTTTDATGQKGIGVEDAAEYWLDYLFYNENSHADNHGHTVNEYWLENSYGLIGVDAGAFGPYHLEGKQYQYGISDFGTADDCPEPGACGLDFDTELVQASLADVTAAQATEGDYDFRFLLHAGYDESGVWLNYGMALFEDQDSVTEAFGPEGYPDHRNWATTRYVPWTSFFSAQAIWSHALPGTLATEGESDGGSVYAHELSHVLGILDNYNNPYAENPDRAYSGPWDMMSRGTFNGPGGPFERYTIPPREGATMGSHHMIRNKLRLGFIPPPEVLTVSKGTLDAARIVRARILQRESPPATTDPNLYSGMRVALGEDQSSCDAAEPLCDGGGYDYYDVEVVNRQGFDSFIPDHGVLIAKTKSADASPFIWVIDAFPEDIGLTDYISADGTAVPYTVGDYRQLADAAFHAGTAPKTKNSFVDEENGLAFYVLDTEVVDGLRVYDVAIQSLDSPHAGGAPDLERVRGKLRRKVTKQVYELTNTGTFDTVYRLTIESVNARNRMLKDLIYVPAGGTERFVVWGKLKGNKKGTVEIVASPL